MNLRLIVILAFLAHEALAANDCVLQTLPLLVSRDEITSLQRSVDAGHEPWRLDAADVASSAGKRELPALLHITSAEIVDIRPLSEAAKSATFLVERAGGQEGFELVLYKPRWLVRKVRRADWTIWVPLKVRIMRCKGIE